MQALGAARLAEDVESEALLAAVAQPFLEAEAVALRLGDLLALLVEEHLVVEALGRTTAEDPRDLARLGDAVDQVLARHLVIDVERDPARRPVDLPLQLGEAAERRLTDARAVLVVEGDQARLGVDHLDRHLEHAAAGRRDREQRRIRLAAVLAERRQHHAHDRVPAAEHLADHLVEAARRVAIGRGQELVIEPEPVEEMAKHRIIVRGEALVGAERVGDLGQGLAEVARSASPARGRCRGPCEGRPCRR